MLFRISAAWARVELGFAAFLAVAVTLLILFNVVTRSLGAAVFWVDELAIYAMAWMTFLAASASFHHRSAVSVRLLPDTIAPGQARTIDKAVDVVVFATAVAMLWACWRWFRPLDLALAGFDTGAFQAATFNFIYAEPTTTLGLPKYLFWLVMWLFAIGMTLHSTMHLLRRPGERAP